MTTKKNDLAPVSVVDASNERRDVLKKIGIAAGALVATSVARSAHASPTGGATPPPAPTPTSGGTLPMTTPIMDLGLTDAEKALIPAKAYPLTKADLIALFTPGNEQLSPAVKALTVAEIEAVKGVFYRKWKIKTTPKSGSASLKNDDVIVKCCCCPCCCATAVTQPAASVLVA